ncbi:MAG TPA: transcription antitermination factor NusB [Actinomycetota bacterium]|jgi:N utilization substance protein B
MSAGEGPAATPRPAGAATGHRRRRIARRAAIDVLYQSDIRDCTPSQAMAEWRAAGHAVPDYAADIVAGVEAGMRDIDRLLGESAEEWTVARMVAVDRAILRVAVYEMRTGLAPAVAVSEAVAAANELSTADSGRFVNGVLGRVARTLGADEPSTMER